MMLRVVWKLLFVLTATIVPSNVAMLIGDEHFQDLEGRFWAFYAGGVAVVNPETCQVETEILVDGKGDPLQTDGWNDGVYIQYNNQQTVPTGGPVPGATPELNGYILINTRTLVNNSDDEPVSEVYIFDIEARKMINRVNVGINSTSAYAIHTLDEVWVHSERDGYFYIIDVSDVTKDALKTKGRVQGFIGTANPGTLLWDEKGVLGNTGYSSNVGEQFLFNVDLKNLLSRGNLAVNFTLVTQNCTGLNSLAFVSSNFHVYAECSNSGGGILEFNVDNNQVSLVRQHFNVSGHLTELLDGSYVVAVDKEGGKLYMIRPNGNQQASTIAYNVTISGGPEYPTFFNYGYDPADYKACMPLTTFPSLNQTSSAFHDEACFFESRNQSLASIKSLTGAVSLVNCNPNVTKGGVACIDLGGVVQGNVTKPTYIRDAGALRHNLTENATAYDLRRSHKRGTKYDASISNYPEKSLVIVRMDTMEKKCTVQLPGKPYTVVYAPLNATVLPGVGPQPPTSGASTLGLTASLVIMVLSFIFA